jgi:L-lactate dehydrogenase complex protein LldF
MAEASPKNYKKIAAESIANPVLQKSLAGLFNRLGRGAAAAYKALPEGPGLRHIAHDMRMEAIANLDVLLETLAANITKNGGKVFFAADANAAVAHLIELASKNNVKRVVKGKSMVTEEIGLNAAFQKAGIEVAETDLGEYIIQLADEHPSHIIAPAIHKTRYDIGRLFTDKLKIPYEEDPPTLTRAARKALRTKFLTADMGISGCNLACAETGHIAVVSNEGNIRMSSTLPRIHVAVMGMERVTARLTDYDILLRLLTRGAAVQDITTYVSHIGGPRQKGQADGPDEFHLVIIDNGRSKILADENFREMLGCIRCAACLNVCPVYAKIGGHAYGSAYCGPLGAVVTPLLGGINQAADLCQGETLCGACKDACPVNIDLPRMLLELRAKLADGDKRWNVKRADHVFKALFGVWSFLVSHRPIYELMLRLAVTGQRLLPKKRGMLNRLPPPFNGWTQSRNLKPLARKSFNQGYRENRHNREKT